MPARKRGWVGGPVTCVTPLGVGLVPPPEIPTAFLYLGCWFLMAGLVYYFFGMETKGKSIAEIDRELAPA